MKSVALIGMVLFVGAAAWGATRAECLRAAQSAAVTPSAPQSLITA